MYGVWTSKTVDFNPIIDRNESEDFIPRYGVATAGQLIIKSFKILTNDDGVLVCVDALKSSLFWTTIDFFGLNSHPHRDEIKEAMMANQ